MWLNHIPVPCFALSIARLWFCAIFLSILLGIFVRLVHYHSYPSCEMGNPAYTVCVPLESSYGVQVCIEEINPPKGNLIWLINHTSQILLQVVFC